MFWVFLSKQDWLCHPASRTTGSAAGPVALGTLLSLWVPLSLHKPFASAAPAVVLAEIPCVSPFPPSFCSFPSWISTFGGSKLLLEVRG